MSTFNTFDRDLIEINGPANVLRLEGKVDGNTKVVYLFFDMQYMLSSQTECNNIYAIDVNKYLAQTFHELDGSSRIVDFFQELNTSQYRYKAVGEQTEGLRSVSKDNYIKQVSRLMLSSLEWDPSTNKVGRSKIFQNVRLHYMDIGEELFNSLFGTFVELKRFLSNTLCTSGTNLQYAITLLQQISDKVTTFIEVYQAIKDNSQAKPEAHPIFSRAVRKLLYDYSHPSVKKKIVPLALFFLDELQHLLDQTNKTIENFGILHEALQNPPQSLENGLNGYFLDDTETKLGIMGDAIMMTEVLTLSFFDCVSIINDFYLLRRLLDKDYITNGVIYAGAADCRRFVGFLVGEYDFKVTHAAYAAGSVSNLNSNIRTYIKEKKHIDSLLLSSARPQQCSDITDFPKQFA